MVMLLIEDVVINTNDETNGQPIVWRSVAPDITACQTANPLQITNGLLGWLPFCDHRTPQGAATLSVRDVRADIT